MTNNKTHHRQQHHLSFKLKQIKLNKAAIYHPDNYYSDGATSPSPAARPPIALGQGLLSPDQGIMDQGQPSSDCENGGSSGSTVEVSDLPVGRTQSTSKSKLRDRRQHSLEATITHAIITFLSKSPDYTNRMDRVQQHLHTSHNHAYEVMLGDDREGWKRYLSQHENLFEVFNDGRWKLKLLHVEPVVAQGGIHKQWVPRAATTSVSSDPVVVQPKPTLQHICDRNHRPLSLTLTPPHPLQAKRSISCPAALAAFSHVPIRKLVTNSNPSFATPNSTLSIESGIWNNSWADEMDVQDHKKQGGKKDCNASVFVEPTVSSSLPLPHYAA
jgi:hypothetical protein